MHSSEVISLRSEAFEVIFDLISPSRYSQIIKYLGDICHLLVIRKEIGGLIAILHQELKVSNFTPICNSKKMPEGNVVLQTVDWLISLFDGPLTSYHLIGFERYSKPNAKTIRFPLVKPADLQPALDGKLLDIYCKGKWYFMEFEHDISIVAHHGLKGKWTREVELNTQFGFTFAKLTEAGDIIEQSELKFYFSNILNGDFQILKTRAALQEKLDSLAPGFIGRWLVTREQWFAGFAKFTPKKRLRDILMDQTAVVSGLGNFYLAEIFYVMKLDPRAKLGDVDQNALFDAARDIMIGHYTKQLEKVIYNRKVCPAGFKIQLMEVGSRTAHWVPEVQTIGRPV